MKSKRKQVDSHPTFKLTKEIKTSNSHIREQEALNLFKVNNSLSNQKVT